MGGMAPMAPMGGMPAMAGVPTMPTMPTTNPYPVYPAGYGATTNNTVGGGSRLVYTRTDISMEEWKALQPQYRYRSG